MGRMLDLDFDYYVKLSRKNRKYVSDVVDKIISISDSRWWSFDEDNVYSGAKIIFNKNYSAQLYPVTLSLNEDLYHIQFIVGSDNMIARALKKSNMQSIQELLSAVEGFNHTTYSDSLPKKIRLRLNSKKYLKFLNDVEKEAKSFLKNNNISVTKENVCLALTVSFFCNNYIHYVNLPYSESELMVMFFERFDSGLTPEVSLITIVENINFEQALKYAGVPTSWVEEVTGLSFKLA